MQLVDKYKSKSRHDDETPSHLLSSGDVFVPISRLIESGMVLTSTNSDQAVEVSQDGTISLKGGVPDYLQKVIIRRDGCWELLVGLDQGSFSDQALKFILDKSRGAWEFEVVDVSKTDLLTAILLVHRVASYFYAKCPDGEALIKEDGNRLTLQMSPIPSDFEFEQFYDIIFKDLIEKEGRPTAPQDLSDDKLRAAAEAKAVGEMFAAARGETGLREAARAAGISHANLGKIEKGQTDPSLKTIRKIADGIDFDVEIRLIPRDNS